MEKKNTGKTIMIVILLLAVIGLGGYIVYDKVFVKESDGPVKNEKQEVKKDIRLDSRKDYVYDADYNYNGKYTEYKMPYINIDSADASTTNGYLKGLYDSYLKEYDACAVSEGDDPRCKMNLKYEKYTNGNIISVVILHTLSSTAVPDPDYLTYNFNKVTGKLMTYEEVLKGLNITRDAAKAKIEENIKNNKTSASESGIEYTQKNITDGIAYFEKTNDADLKFFVKDNTLNIITRIYRDIERGEFWETVSY